MKTNSTCKFLQKLLFVLFSVLGFTINAYSVRVSNSFYNGTFSVDGTSVSAGSSCELSDGLHVIEMTSKNWNTNSFTFSDVTSLSVYGGGAYSGNVTINENDKNGALASRGDYIAEGVLYILVSGTTVQYSASTINLGPYINSATITGENSGGVEVVSNDCYDDGITLTADYEGSANPTYQWRYSENGSSYMDISGATAITYTPDNVGYYTVKITVDEGKNKTSDPFVLKGPSISPVTVSSSTATSGDVYSGETVLGLDYTANCCTPTFQWQRSTDGSSFSDISGARAESYTASSAGYYRAVLSGPEGITRTSTAFALIPRVTFSALSDFTVCPKSHFNIIPTIAVEGAEKSNCVFTYQWYQNGVAMSGETGDQLTSRTTPVDREYKLVVSAHDNVSGIDFSNEFSVNVSVESSDPLEIDDIVGCQGRPAVVTLPDLGRDFYWRSPGGSYNLSKNTRGNYEYNNFMETPMTRCFAIYDGYLEDQEHFCREKCITKTSTESLYISSQPEYSQTVCKNASPTNLSVTADECTITGTPYTYQWYSNTSRSTTGAVAIDGATSATYTPSTSTVGTSYYFCKVTQGENTINSAISTVIVADSPEAPVIADTSVNNNANFIVPLNAQYYQEEKTSNAWVSKAKGETIGPLYSDKNYYLFKARNVNEETGCVSEEITFYVKSMYADPNQSVPVGEISPRRRFSNQNLCRYETAESWFLQGACGLGTNNLTYTWYKNTVNNRNGSTIVSTKQSFTPSTDDASGTYYYWCVIGYRGRSDTCQVGPQTVTLNGPAEMHISDVEVCGGNNIVFASDADVSSYTVSVTRGGSVQTASASGTAITILSANVTQEENTTETYTITATSDGCSVIEKPKVTLYESTAVRISDVHMDDVSVCTNETIPTLEVEGESCDGAVTYQWYKNTTKSTEGAVVISGATNSTYTPARGDEDSYYYYCVATRGGRNATSSITKVSIYEIPTVTFTIPSGKTSFYCTEEIGVQVAESFKRYDWGYITDDTYTTTKTTTSTNTNAIPLVCGASPAPDHVFVNIVDEHGCKVSRDIAITINDISDDHVYYYWGPTGADSQLNDPEYWSTCPSFYVDHDTRYWNSSTSLTKARMTELIGLSQNADCGVLGNFITDGCKYIINKDDVELLDEQSWTISGAGSKLVIGDGTWATLSSTAKIAGASYTSDYVDESIKGTKILISSSPTFVANKDESLKKLAANDFRSDAKSFKISGTLNLGGDITMDVMSGSSVEIATDKGTPRLGTLMRDKVYNFDPAWPTKNNVILVPGSIVTYSGDGTKAIQSATYSNVYINNNSPLNVVFPTLMDIKQTLAFDVPSARYSAGMGTTVIFSGEIDQTIPRMMYYNLETEVASVKTITPANGENLSPVIVNGTLTIGAASTLNASDADIYLTDVGGLGKCIFCDGIFKPGTSTVHYANCTINDTVAAVNYYNLDLRTACTRPNRTFENKGTAIGIAGSFIPGDAVCNVTNSTVEFNGEGLQECPEFTFYNLTINSAAVSNNASNIDPANAVKLTGDVTVRNKLTFTRGILNTDANEVIVSNSSANAVGPGYYKSFKDASFLVGQLTRRLPANLDGSDISTSYVYPVGNDVGYNPLTLSSITTVSGTPMVTVSSVHGSVNPSDYTSPLTSVNDDIYWIVDGNTAYKKASVSLGESNGLSGGNCVAFSPIVNGEFRSLHGTIGSKLIERSDIAEEGIYSIGQQTIINKTYYYDCSGGKDITDVNSWSTGRNGTGTKATSFYEDYAEWIVECNATVETKPLNITGASSKLRVVSGRKLTLHNSCIASSFIMDNNSTVEVGIDGAEMEDQPYLTVLSSCEIGEGAVLNNYGQVNFYVGSIAMRTSTIENYGEINFNGTDLTMTGSDSNIGDAAHFLNHANVNMINSSLRVANRFTQLLNDDGAMWFVDNSASSDSKSIYFDNCEFVNGNPNAYVSVDCGSTFYVKHSDVVLYYGGMNDSQAEINGNFIVEDGNLSVRRKAQGGGTFSIKQQCGKMFVVDTDGSGDDGLLTIEPSAGGGGTFNVGGVLYTTGLVGGSGSGDSFNIKNGGFVFIGNLGATTPSYQWEYAINVETGGVLHYCGNRTATADLVGSVQGELYYALNYYENGASDPSSEGDFVVSGSYNPIYTSMLECIGAFEEGYLKGAASLLPIELTLLYGICIDENKVELRWQTASETNNDYFTILRSFDGINFEEIGIVMGAGTTTEVHNYEFYDTDDKNGIVYYKLRQVDYDGNYTDSKVIAVQTCGKNARFSIGSEEIEVFFRNPQANYVVITSVTGQIFYSKKFTNVEEARIAVPQRKGIYIISVIDSKQITSEKFIR